MGTKCSVWYYSCCTLPPIPPLHTYGCVSLSGGVSIWAGTQPAYPLLLSQLTTPMRRPDDDSPCATDRCLAARGGEA